MVPTPKDSLQNKDTGRSDSSQRSVSKPCILRNCLLLNQIFSKHDGHLSTIYYVYDAVDKQMTHICVIFTQKTFFSSIFERTSFSFILLILSYFYSSDTVSTHILSIIHRVYLESSSCKSGGVDDTLYIDPLCGILLPLA